MEILISVFEYIGIFAFAVSGAITAMRERMDLFGVYCVACISALSGGVLRDIVCNKKPDIFQRDVYTLAGIIGAVLLWIIYDRTSRIVSMGLSMLLIVALRMLCYHFHINLPVVKYSRNR